MKNAIKNKYFTLTLFMLGAVLNSFAQAPANDLICNATVVTPNIVCNGGTNSGATTSATSPTATPTCWLSAPSNDVWYSFVATSTDMTISTDASGLTLTDTQLALYSSSNNTCSGTITQVDCDENSGTNVANNSIINANNLTVGNTYFVRVDGYSTNVGSFCLTVKDSYQAGQTSCSAQVVYPSNAACANTNGNTAYNIDQTLGGAEYPALGVNYCGCDDETGQAGGWSTFTANSSSVTVTNLTAGANATPLDFTIFSGTCSSLSCISCSSVAKGGSAVFSGLTVGTTYFILTTYPSSQPVGANSPGYERLDICITSSVACTAPTNNTCAGASVITANTQYTGTNACATTDSPPLLCSGSTENNVWLSWTCPAGWTGDAFFQLWNENCNNGAQSSGVQVSIYNAAQTCGAASGGCVVTSNTALHNDININFTPTPGSTYLINYDGYAGESCTYQYEISNSPAITVLPVNLLYFNATKNNSKVQLDWKTSTEVNNDYFTIQRSLDAAVFEDIGKVKGSGTTTKPVSYTFFDEHPYLRGASYYRLKQTDYNGKNIFSNIAGINFSTADPVLRIVPNPTENHSDVVFDCMEDFSNATLKIVDLNGRVILNKEIMCSKGTNVTSVDLSEYPTGVYCVTLTTETNVYLNKLVKRE